MAERDLLVRIDVNSSQAMAATSAYEKSLARLDAQLATAAKAQARYDAAVASSGASSDEAAAAQKRYEASLARVSAAQDRAAITSARSSEAQAAAAAKAASAQEAAAAKQAAAYKKVGKVAGAIGLVAAVGLGAAAKAAADFDAKMAQVQSLSRASAGDMAKLASAAHDYANIGFSASEAADAEIELTKAGIGVQQQLGGALSATMNLAAAGQMNVGDATQIAASAMTQFKLSAADMPHVADLLAAGADKALGSVSDLGDALKFAGLPAHQLGISIDDTTAALAEFAQAGLIGSQGGTTLQQMLIRLEKPTAAGADEMKKLGISAYDAQGNFVGLASLAGQLHDKLGDLTVAQRNAALATIFSSRSVRGANILYQDGAAGVKQWEQNVEQSGFAAEQARGKMNSLSGDLQKLGATIVNDAIDIGQQMQPTLRTITQDLTKFGNVIGDLPDPLKSFGLRFGLTVAAVGLGVAAFLRLQAAMAGAARTLGVLTAEQAAAAGTADTMAASETAAASASKFNLGRLGLLAGVGAAGIGLGIGGSFASAHGDKVLGSTLSDAGTGALAGGVAGSVIPVVGTAAGAALGGLVGGLYGLIKASNSATSAQAQLADAASKVAISFDAATGKLSEASQAAIQKQLETNGLIQQANKAGVSTSLVERAAMGDPYAFQRILARQQATTTQQVTNTAAYGRFGPYAGDVANSSPLDNTVAFVGPLVQRIMAETRKTATAVGLKAKAPATANTYAMGGGLNGAVAGTGAVVLGDNKLAASADAARLAVEGLTKAQVAQDTQFANSIGSVASLTLAIAQSAQTTKGLSGVMNGSKTAINAQSVAGANLIQSMTGIASAALAVKGSQSRQTQAIETGRKAIIAQSETAGASAPVAKALADQLLNVANQANKIPSHKSTKVDQQGVDQTKADVQGVIDKYNALPKDVRTDVGANGIPQTQAGIEALQKKYSLTPKQVQTLIEARDLASGVIGRVRASLANLNGYTAKTWIVTTNETRYTHSGVQVGGAVGGLVARLPRRAGGGPVFGGSVEGGGYIAAGPGTPTSDSMFFRGSKREYVVKAAAVDKYGVATFDSYNSMRAPAPARASQMLALGGRVGGRPSTAVAAPVHPRDMGDTQTAVVAALNGVATRVAAVEAALGGRLRVNVDNAREVATGVRDVARGEVEQEAAFAASARRQR